MIKVLYGYEAFEMQCFGGVSRCFVELYKHLPTDVSAMFGLVESDNIYMQSLGFESIGSRYAHFLPHIHFPHKSYLFHCINRIGGVYYGTGYGTDENRRRTIQLLQRGDYDVFHPTFFDDYYLPYLNDKPFVLTIHDMIPELYPQYFKRNDGQIVMKKKLAPLASKIIAVSETTKRDVMRILNVEEDKIDVIYHGVNSVDFNWHETSFFDFPYLLFVGDRGKYKGFDKMCMDLIPILEKYRDLHIVCTGLPFNTQEKEWIERNAKGRVIHKYVVNSGELSTLYHFAKAFIYPSEYEGFGIPILEAYQSQCPVILNNASCFPEIAGDAALYFQVNGERTDIADVVDGVLSMPYVEREELLERQNQRLLGFSWEKSAEKLAEVYKSVL